MSEDQPMAVDDKDLKQFVRIGRAIMWKPEYREFLEQHGICLTPARFYNEIPLLQDLREGFENVEEAPYAFSFLDGERCIATIRELSAFTNEFDPPQSDKGGFFWGNRAFSHIDAMAYYGFIRWLKPKRIIEIGSGFSTAVAVEAAARNGFTQITCIEPFPGNLLKGLPVELLESPVQKFAAEYFNDTLADGDFLFIDSTHTVKISSDCAHLYLRILPKIRRNIVVHVHDIHIPCGMSTNQAINLHIYWTEQHLLSAYLLDNPKIEFLFGSRLASIDARREITDLLNGKCRVSGGSFWFKLNGATSGRKRRASAVPEASA